MLLEEVWGGGAAGEGDGAGAEFALGVEEGELVDEAGGEEGAVEGGAGFEEEGADGLGGAVGVAALMEGGEGGVEVEAGAAVWAGQCGEGEGFGSGLLEGGDAVGWGFGGGEEEEVVGGGLDEGGLYGGEGEGVE